MQYKAHIPAGMAFASAATLLSGDPLDLLMIAGGAIGGALPDIDVAGDDNQGSAVQHLGTKASSAMSKTVVLSPLAKLTRPVAMVFDAVILGSACRLWRLLATRVLGPAYMAVAKSAFGRAIRLDRDDPSAHRGGLTHSLLSMLIFSVPLYPLLTLLHARQVWVGIMWGMLSHLVCDAFCKSGVKFLWPWVPDIGFRNEDGVGGREGIKLLPAGVLMKTGKCSTKAELDEHRGHADYDEFRKYYRLESGWRRFFRSAALVLPVMVVLGVGPASGKVAFAGTTYDIMHKDEQAAISDLTGTVSPVNETDPTVTTAGDASRFADGRGTRVDEHKGPTSLTYGDLDANTLPAGIIKMPDESLYVASSGAIVSAESLSDPTLMLTDDEKSRLIAAANWQRIGNGEAAQEVSEAIDGAKQQASDFFDGLLGQSTDITLIGAPETDGGGTPVVQVQDTSDDGDLLGFHGLTPFTQGG